jgi:hypothetical protein
MAEMRVLCATTLLWAAVVGGAGCTADGPEAKESTTISGATLPDESPDDTPDESPDDSPNDSRTFTVASLDLSFQLPPSFVLAEDPELEFLARSLDPRSVLSIARDGPSVIDHGSEPGERLSVLEGLGDEAVIVENAVLSGLPAGLAANELFVANGDRSFSLILSATEADLDAIWEQLLDSIAVG